MPLAPLYEDFSALKPTPEASLASDTIAQEQALKSFEDGYQAGWDDAIKAQADTQTQISADFAQTLQEMSFTYHEALFKLSRAMQPLMSELLEKMLPAMARGCLAAHLMEQLDELLTDQVNQPIEIVVSSENEAALRELISDGDAAPFDIVSEASLGAGQAFVRIGAAERSIDLDGVVAGIETAMSAYFYEMEQEQKHG